MLLSTSVTGVFTVICREQLKLLKCSKSQPFVFVSLTRNENIQHNTGTVNNAECYENTRQTKLYEFKFVYIGNPNGLLVFGVNLLLIYSQSVFFLKH